MSHSFSDLRKAVIDVGLCTGCGTCAGVCNNRCIAMTRRQGEPEPELVAQCQGCGGCWTVCPGGVIPLGELEEWLYGVRREPSSYDLGVYRSIGRGHAEDNAIRRAGTSGGIVTAILKCALEHGVIDSALVTGYDRSEPYHTQPYLATSHQIVSFAQSKYAMVAVNELLGTVAQSSHIRKVGVVGCPCHIHGIRKLQQSQVRPDISEKIAFVIGLFCATQFYFEGTRHLLLEECGLQALSDVRTIQYRGGEWPGHFIVSSGAGEERVLDRHHYVYHFLLPNYRRDRCMMCLDWSAELSDVSVGDYGPVKEDGERQWGESTFIARSRRGEELMRMAEELGYITSMPLKMNHILGSPGYEIKKHSAGHRWAQRRMYGWPVPDYQYTPKWEPLRRDTYFLPEKIRKSDT